MEAKRRRSKTKVAYKKKKQCHTGKVEGGGLLMTPASASQSSPRILRQRLHRHSLVARWKC